MQLTAEGDPSRSAVDCGAFWMRTEAKYPPAGSTVISDPDRVPGQTGRRPLVEDMAVTLVVTDLTSGLRETDGPTGD